ncbi:MAG: hypothetical protein OXS30_11905 [Chloroflexota bacterium]|nr:hypothetical protein [Chloroflexota bacterium]
MLRKLAIVGLGLPLTAIIAALVYLLFFGTSEPTFDAATRELALDHTVLRIRDEPPAALVVPTEPPASVVLVLVLPDDDRHVWSATRSLGLLDYVDSHELAMIPVTGLVERDQLLELATLAARFVVPNRIYLAAFRGAPLAAVCDGEVGDAWSGVIVVEAGEAAALNQCADLPVLRIEDQDGLGGRIVQWMLERQ